MAEQPAFDITDVGYVHRITVGSHDPNRQQIEEEMQAAIDQLNHCLADYPKGRILGMQKMFTVLNVGEHQVVLQSITYHVGFRRKPAWLENASSSGA